MVSSAPPTPSPAGPPDSRRTQGTLTQQESGGEPWGWGRCGRAGRLPGLGPGRDSRKCCYLRARGLGGQPPGAGGRRGLCQGLPGAQEGTDRFSALLQLSWGDSWLEVSYVFGRAGEGRLLGEQEREGREK